MGKPALLHRRRPFGHYGFKKGSTSTWLPSIGIRFAAQLWQVRCWPWRWGHALETPPRELSTAAATRAAVQCQRVAASPARAEWPPRAGQQEERSIPEEATNLSAGLPPTVAPLAQAARRATAALPPPADLRSQVAPPQPAATEPPGEPQQRVGSRRPEESQPRAAPRPAAERRGLALPAGEPQAAPRLRAEEPAEIPLPAGTPADQGPRVEPAPRVEPPARVALLAVPQPVARPAQWGTPRASIASTGLTRATTFKPGCFSPLVCPPRIATPRF